MRPRSSRLPSAAGLVLLCLLASACSGAAAGAVCSTDGDCREMTRCVPTATLGRRVCMTECAPGTRLCVDGTVCLEASGISVCYIGGGTSIGDTCSANEQCEPGTVCPLAIGACVQACTVGIDAPCRDSERCEGPSPLEGVCRAIPDAGAADAGAGAGP